MGGSEDPPLRRFRDVLHRAAGGGDRPHEALVVGDTPHDVEAAHGAGAIAVGVATGHYSVAELRGAGAEHVLSSLEQQLPLAG